MADRVVGFKLPGRRIVSGLVVTAALALTAGCSSSAQRPSDSPGSSPKVGGIAPSFRSADPLGGTVSVGAGVDRPVLLAFVNTAPSAPDWAASRAVGALCVSMATQYASRGLRVVVVDVGGASPATKTTDSDLVNAYYDWHLGQVQLVDAEDGPGIATRYGIASPPTLLLINASDRVLDVWSGRVLPATTALAVQAALPGGPTAPTSASPRGA